MIDIFYARVRIKCAESVEIFHTVYCKIMLNSTARGANFFIWKLENMLSRNVNFAFLLFHIFLFWRLSHLSNFWFPKHAQNFIARPSFTAFYYIPKHMRQNFLTKRSYHFVEISHCNIIYDNIFTPVSAFQVLLKWFLYNISILGQFYY